MGSGGGVDSRGIQPRLWSASDCIVSKKLQHRVYRPTLIAMLEDEVIFLAGRAILWDIVIFLPRSTPKTRLWLRISVPVAVQNRLPRSTPETHLKVCLTSLPLNMCSGSSISGTGMSIWLSASLASADDSSILIFLALNVVTWRAPMLLTCWLLGSYQWSVSSTCIASEVAQFRSRDQ